MSATVSKKRKLAKVISAAIVSVVVVSGSAAAETNNKERLLSMTCGGLFGEMEDVKASLRHAVRQEFKDEPILVKMESNYVYLTPRASISFYETRRSYLEWITKKLGCHA